jgi:hypothetical protein
MLAAIKVPTITAVRIAILIASFIVVLLVFPGIPWSARPAQVTLVMQPAYQSREFGGGDADMRQLPEKQGYGTVAA